jgi:transcription termination factor NusB
MLNKLFGNPTSEKTVPTNEKNLKFKDKIVSPKPLTNKEKYAYLVHSSLLDSLYQMENVGEHNESLNEIIETLIQHSFDPGCNRIRDWRAKGSTETETIGAVEIYNRSTLCNFIISQITDEHGKYNEKPCKLVFWDGSGIKNADAAKDAEKRPYADLAINKIARASQETFDIVNRNYGGENYVARWAGDEFFGCIIGGDQAKAEQIIKHKLKEKLGGQFGNFLETKEVLDQKTGKKIKVTEIIKKPLGLKETPSEPAVNFIDVPIEPEQNLLFIDFLKKGLILKQSDIENIQHEISYFPGVSTKDFLETVYSNNFYPYGVDSNSQKVEFIKALSPKHGEQLQLALDNNFDLPTKNGKLNVFDTLLNYVEKTVFHQLLGRNVGTFTEMYENLLKNQPEWITTEDIRFVKELNENNKFSYVGADLTLKDGSDSITSITNENRGFVSHYQRGGTSFQTYNENLHDKTISNLNGLRSIEVNRKKEIYGRLKQSGLIAPEFQRELELKINREESTKIPIGFSQVKINYPLDRTNAEEVETAVKNGLNRLFEFSKVSWHMNFFRLIVEQVINNKDQHAQFYELLEAYLTQKRSDDRMKEIEENILRIPEFAPDINEYAPLIRDILRDIVENYKNNKPAIEMKPLVFDDLDQYMSKPKSTYPGR